MEQTSTSSGNSRRNYSAGLETSWWTSHTRTPLTSSASHSSYPRPTSLHPSFPPINIPGRPLYTSGIDSSMAGSLVRVGADLPRKPPETSNPFRVHPARSAHLFRNRRHAHADGISQLQVNALRYLGVNKIFDELLELWFRWHIFDWFERSERQCLREKRRTATTSAANLHRKFLGRLECR